MDPFVTIPREALAELLRASGSTLTPEQYLAAQADAEAIRRRYAGRARAAAWSKNILLIAAVLSWVWLVTPLGFDFEDALITVALTLITAFEVRVHRYFLAMDPRGATLGFRNQSIFAALLLFYGLYHALAPSIMQMPVEVNNLVDPDTMALVHTITRYAYVVIGVVGGISQFALAWYYRGVQKPGN